MTTSVIFVLGLPGAGKGTQCSLLNQKYGFNHISAGDLLRKVRADVTSPHRQIVQEHLAEGKLIPANLMVSIFRAEIERQQHFWRTLTDNDKTVQHVVLIDGFPRSLDNLSAWNEQFSNVAPLKAVLLFDGPVDMFTERCLKREGRPEDNVETLRKRVDNFYQQSKPVVEHFRELGLLYTIDTSGAQEDILENVENVLKNLQILPKV